VSGSSQPVGPLSALGTAALPVYARIGNGAGFMWQQNPVHGGDSAEQVHPGERGADAQKIASFPGASDPLLGGPRVDYLVAYWLAAYPQVAQ
jgi:hypothetical protein